MRRILIEMAIAYHSDFNNIYQIIKNQVPFRIKEREKVALIEDNCITIVDKDYPCSYSKLLNPPFVIHYQGNKDIFNLPNKIGLVFQNIPTEFDLEILKKILNSPRLKEATIIFRIINKEQEKLISLLQEINNYSIVVISDPIEEINSSNFNDKTLFITSVFDDSVIPIKRQELANNLFCGILDEAIVISLNSSRSENDLADHLKYYLTNLEVLPTNVESKLINNSLLANGFKIYSNEKT